MASRKRRYEQVEQNSNEPPSKRIRITTTGSNRNNTNQYHDKLSNNDGIMKDATKPTVSNGLDNCKTMNIDKFVSTKCFNHCSTFKCRYI